MLKEPIRVLAIVCQLNRGGLESRLMDIIRHIDNERVKIDIFTYRLDKGIFDDEVIKYGGKVFYNVPLTPRNMFWYVNYFKEFLINHPEYKIIHAHQDAWCSVFCKGAYKAGVPVRIAHSRTAISMFTLNNLVKDIIKLPTKKYATHYFAVSKLAGQWLFGNKAVKRGEVQILPNAIETEKFIYNINTRNKIRSELGLLDQNVIMHVGNFTPPKNHMFLLKVFAELVKKDEKARLVLVGGGENDYLQKYIIELGIQRYVIFLGVRKDVNELLQAADVFVFPSIFEGLPGAVIEAQAAGLPCLISDTIASEVCITPLVKQLSIKENVEIWSKSILESYKVDRKNMSEVMEQKGYDIKSLVLSLTEFYEQAVKGE